MPAQTPEECDALFAANLNSGNLEGLLSLYEPSASMVQLDGPPARGTAEIRQRLEAFVAIGPKYTTQTVNVIQADEDLAVLDSDWSVTADGPDGKPMTLSGKEIEIVRRQPDGTWRIAVEDPFGRN